MAQPFSDLNLLTVEKDEPTLPLCNIWQFSFERIKVLLNVDSEEKQLNSCVNFKYP